MTSIDKYWWRVWKYESNNWKLAGVLFLDIRKAFDSIDHSISLEKVEFYEVSDRELMWCKYYLTSRKRQRFVKGHLSCQRNIPFRVPQGSILGPLRFLIYINDLPNCFEFSTPCLYGDDTQIFASRIDANVFANNVNSDLQNIRDWLTVNRL